MAQKVSDAAGRFVAGLSRRRFLVRLGAGGAALAGLTRARPAFGSGVACRSIAATSLPRSFSGCTDPGQCNAGRVGRGLERVCADEKLAQCREGLHCDPGSFEHCLSSFRGEVTNCRVVGHCSGGRVLCECTLVHETDPFTKVRRGPECGCDCHVAIPPNRP